jgi:hypothetical protein
VLTEISPTSFKTIPWKNGLGHTTELAISDGGNLNNFDWRLSIATVANDGKFSNFNGYERNLVLIEGNGINLLHDNKRLDQLTNLLDIANFDGGRTTYGKLADGIIKDFNVMSNNTTYQAQVNSYKNQQTLNLTNTINMLTFIYSVSVTTKIKTGNDQLTLKACHLAKISNNDKVIEISGKSMIVVQFTPKL